MARLAPALCLLLLFAATVHSWRLADFFHAQQSSSTDGDCPKDLAEDEGAGFYENVDWCPHPHPPRPHPPGPHPHPPHPPHPGPPPHRHPGPPFYHGLWGPRFKVLNRTCGFSIREYNRTTWAVTKASGWTWEFAVHKGVRALMPYFLGKNENHTHIPPSVPVVSHFIHRKNFSDCGKEFLVARFVPLKPNSTVPEPSNTSHLPVRVHTFPPRKVYVRQFGGLGFHWTVLREMKALARALERSKVNVTEGRFITAQYDTPTTIFHRHNEVWWVAMPKNATAEHAALDLGTLWDQGGLTLT